MYIPGEYVVEVRAWADNNFDTGRFEELTVNIVDPCLTAVLTIDQSVFKSAPSVTLIQYVNYDTKTLIWTDDIVTSSMSNEHLCGPLKHILTYELTGSELDTAIFTTNDLTSYQKQLNVFTD